MTEAIRTAHEPGPAGVESRTADAETVSTPAPTVAMSVEPRFAQLTYTSYHREGGSGGWQVKDVRGDLGPVEQQALTAGIGTQLAPTHRLPMIPTDDERRALPRRLVHGALPGGAHAFWHTIPAGTDSSGRPGNVFAHVVLDRRPLDPEPPLRPSDLLGAPQWRTPYGADEVLASSLDEVGDPPWDGAPATRETVVPFLVETAMARPAVLAALLDAVVHALRGGPAVVLGVDDAERAEWWIAGVMHLMSPATSRGVLFSTNETAEALSASPPWHLAVVGRPVLGDVADTALVLLPDDTDAVDLGDLEGGQPHRTRPGSEIPVGPWSVLALEVLQDEELALRTLAAADGIAAAVGDRGLPPGWPLAMAVTLAPDDLPDAQSEARQVLASCAPPGLRRVPDLARAHRRALLGPLGPSTADAWDATGGGVAGVDRREAAAVYLERALLDDAWLLQDGRPPAPENPPAPGEDWSDRVAEAVQRVASPTVSTSLLVRVLDLVSRARLLDLSAAGPLDSLLRPLVDEELAPALVDPVHGPALVDAVGRVSEHLTSEVLVPGLERRLATMPEPPGRRVPPVVLAWLHPRPPVLPSPRTLGTGATPAVLTEVAVQATTVFVDPSMLRALALDEALHRRTQDGDDTALARMALGKAFGARQLRPLARAYGIEALATLLPAALRVAIDTEDMVELVDQIRDTVPPGGRGALGEVRRLADLRFHASLGTDQFERGSVGEALADALRTATELVATFPGVPPAPVARLVTVALLVDLAGTAGRPGDLATAHAERHREVCAWLRRERAPRERVAHLHGDLARALDDHAVDEVELAAAALAAAVTVVDPERPTAPELWRSVVGSGPGTAVDALLAERLATRGSDGVEDLLRAVERTVGHPAHAPGDLDRTARALWNLPGPPRQRFARMGRT